MDPELLRALRAAGLITQQQQMAYLQSIMPPTDPYMGMGMSLNPDDFKDALKSANNQVDYQRDLNSLGADFMSATMAGPQAYDRSAFDPIITRRKVDAPPNYSLLSAGLQSSNPLEKRVAQWAASGLTSVGIKAQLEGAATLAANGESTGDELLDKAGNDLITRGRKDQDSGDTYYDFSDVLSYADQLATQVGKLPTDAVREDPITGKWTIDAPMPLHDPVTGEYYYEEEEDSPLTKEFRERGLYSPFDEYELSDFSAEGGEYAQQAADYAAEAEALRAAAPTDLDSVVDKAYARMLASQKTVKDAPFAPNRGQGMTPWLPGQQPMIGPPARPDGMTTPRGVGGRGGDAAAQGRLLADGGDFGSFKPGTAMRAIGPGYEGGGGGGSGSWGDGAPIIMHRHPDDRGPMELQDPRASWPTLSGSTGGPVVGDASSGGMAGLAQSLSGAAPDWLGSIGGWLKDWKEGGTDEDGGWSYNDGGGEEPSDEPPGIGGGWGWKGYRNMVANLPVNRAKQDKKDWQAALRQRSQTNLPIALLERDARMATNKAAGRYQFDFQKPEAQAISQGNLDLQLARAMGRTPLQDQQALRRSMGMYGLGI